MAIEALMSISPDVYHHYITYIFHCTHSATMRLAVGFSLLASLCASTVVADERPGHAQFVSRVKRGGPPEDCGFVRCKGDSGDDSDGDN